MNFKNVMLCYVMFGSDQYLSTEKVMNNFSYVSVNIIFSNLNFGRNCFMYFLSFFRPFPSSKKSGLGGGVTIP